MIVTSTIVACT